MCVASLSTTLVWNISHSTKNWVRYDQNCLVVVMESAVMYSTVILLRF